MKFETDSAIRSPGRSRRLASAAIALVVSGAACSADNLLGLDDGSGAVNAGANVEAFDMSGGSNCDQLAVAGGSTEQINQTWIKMVAPQDGATVRAFKPPMFPRYPVSIAVLHKIFKPINRRRHKSVIPCW